MAYRYEKNYAGGQDIVVDGWEKGIAPSPYAGIADVRNVNINDIPGAVFASPKTEDFKINALEVSFLGVTRTFTADAGTDIITLSSSLQQDYISFTLTTTGTLPGGLSTGTIYYGRLQTLTTFKISTTLANAVNAVYVNITSTGSGTHTLTTTDIGTIKCSTKDLRTGVIYAVDSNNYVWMSILPGGSLGWTLIAGNTLTQGSGNGIAVWQNYLFVFRSRSIDVYGALNDYGTAAWSNSWQTLNASTSYTGLHKTLVGSDNILYWTDFDNAASGSQRLGYIGSVRLAGASAFAPGTGATFTYSNNSLDFPSDEEPAGLTELNNYLVVANNYSGVNSNGNWSKLYYWDRVSASYFQPLIIPESPVYEIINSNNLIYVFCGGRGRVYKSNLSSLAVAFKLPDQLYSPTSTSVGYEGLPLGGYGSQSSNGLRVQISFGVQARTTRRKIFFVANPYGATALYSFDVETNLLQIEAKPINGYSLTSNTGVELFAVETLSSGGSTGLLGTEIIWFGLYYSGTFTYTIEKWDVFAQGDTGNYATYNGYVISDLVPTGGTNNRKSFEQLEYKLDRKMISGSGLKIYYRTAIGESWSLLSTEDFSTYGAITSRVISLPLVDTEWIQIKVELNRNTVLREIRLR
tara:strand:+ start:2511 stop:4412 length:1902 start_codon:yes stop_codon:yes gene_type:complete